METTKKILTNVKMPFCPGCGHGVCVRSTSKALENLGYGAKDVVMVSDIGCAGLVDPLFATHTIHGLHGRSPALGLGVTLGLDNPNKKVVVVQGDGGATIGLQHILEASRRNVDMTLIVLNNLLYGMTGGQMSGLSTSNFKQFKHSDDNAEPYDIVNLAYSAGAAFSVRVNNISNFEATLKEAIEIPGFSLVELSSLCTSHGMKKILEFKNYVVEEEKFTNKRPVGVSLRRNTASLFSKVKVLDTQFNSTISETIGVVIAGSAGGGIQSAAKMLAQAGILSGLYATMKGEYPITVGTGFSAAEVILSKKPIQFTGLEKPSVALAVTEDGWNKVKNRISSNSKVIVDAKINTESDYETKEFLKEGGKKGAALSAISYWIQKSNVFPIDALLKVVEGSKYEESLKSAIKSAEKFKELVYIDR
ncbi:thiamine pyrophosphate-dependent enzyme [Lutibacter sp.]|uniref:thiamine pyrophosphate-dependent enzyme n=1 Tax=Lutibacter sp. TaxID=1925666 RepID=UPI0025C71DCB|nr:thiamine pyrophosphate-dependent enzyme [Lutibacter sp.]MCF6182875.1 thiamine pyrophosphate-dependent enzyme [Lutibacter sp.]